ncbi:hypothetical protein EYF80_010908 [Liparis tanakae]|uniref:Uncharacterized protein n=1 Tax=Liparis tanakae TaxID=230148 RepID=A0A4Z2ILY4_9TELE|nr:hypothetical protein EYF80_010908 [Liparis tanakae]
MTMMSTICSHTMRQKSPNVLGKGPGGHKGVGFEQKEGKKKGKDDSVVGAVIYCLPEEDIECYYQGCSGSLKSRWKQQTEPVDKRAQMPGDDSRLAVATELGHCSQTVKVIFKSQPDRISGRHHHQ